MIIAQGKRGAALGQRHQMNPSPFSEFGFPGLTGKPNSEKGEAGGVGGLPRAAASAFAALRHHESAALPWATIAMLLRGARRPPRSWFVPSPLPLHEVPASKGPPVPEPSELPRGLGVGEVIRKRQSTAALQDAGAHAQVGIGSGAQSASECRGLLSHFKLSHLPFPYANDTGAEAENMTTSLLCTAEDKRLAVAES